MTPSDQIDQVWHLHLLYTRSYWIDLCENTIGIKIHHEPTKGGTKEKQKFSDHYHHTRLLYKEAFQHEPPSDIWPDEGHRLSETDFKRVNTNGNWMVRKFKLF